MKCPHCHEEAELESMDADFAEHTLIDAVATIDVVKKEVCDQCYQPVQVRKYKMLAVLTEDLEHHKGIGHRMQLHPQTIEAAGDAYEVGYSLVCSCGISRARAGTAVLLREEETKPTDAPWE